MIFARPFAQILRQMASLRWMIPRPQYHPKFGPIEYKICEVTLRIKLKKEANWDMDDLEQQIMDIAMDIGQFESTFLHCEYQR